MIDHPLAETRGYLHLDTRLANLGVEPPIQTPFSDTTALGRHGRRQTPV